MKGSLFPSQAESDTQALQKQVYMENRNSQPTWPKRRQQDDLQS